MNKDEKFEAWLSNVCKRILPASEMGRVRTLARELAEGVTKDFWQNSITGLPIGQISFNEIFNPESTRSEEHFQSIIASLFGENKRLIEYAYKRWHGNYFPFQLMKINQYIDDNSEMRKPAFDLIAETEPAHIFISYKRSESSAFAMYVLTRLKQENLDAFVDLSLVPGEDWHAGLKDRIGDYDYFIVLIGQETLKSEVCIKEITWAVEAELTIIPVWHNGFKYNADKWKLPEKIDRILGTTHSIQVREESASGYNAAMAELLNVFGITP